VVRGERRPLSADWSAHFNALHLEKRGGKNLKTVNFMLKKKREKILGYYRIIARRRGRKYKNEKEKKAQGNTEIKS